MKSKWFCLFFMNDFNRLIVLVLVVMLLTRKEILQYIKKKKIVVTPFDESQVRDISIQLHLGYIFRKPKKKNKVSKIIGKDSLVVVIDEQTSSDDYYYDKFFDKPIQITDYFTLKPGELALATTLEKIKLSDDIVGILDGKSKIARLGLFIHISSQLIKPGSNNITVLELYNASPFTIKLKPGSQICQLTLHSTHSKVHYNGSFERQTKP